MPEDLYRSQFQPEKVRFLLQELEEKNPNIKQSIFNAMKNINLDYVLGYTNGNKSKK